MVLKVPFLLERMLPVMLMGVCGVFRKFLSIRLSCGGIGPVVRVMACVGLALKAYFQQLSVFLARKQGLKRLRTCAWRFVGGSGCMIVFFTILNHTCSRY